MVGSALLIVNATVPTSYAHHGEVKTGSTKMFTLVGGAGLQLGPQQDTVMIAAGSCSHGPAGGTTLAMNLGPDDSSGATIATVGFTWKQVGTYLLCYRAPGGNYTQVRHIEYMVMK